MYRNLQFFDVTTSIIRMQKSRVLWWYINHVNLAACTACLIYKILSDLNQCYLVTSQTRVNRVSRMHHPTVFGGQSDGVPWKRD